ncbi:MAG: hypothetical protein PHE02_11710 [Lachnospiraceae bacterium]|nr:hypothetical protein [Lachnospiraceae bacterium]
MIKKELLLIENGVIKEKNSNIFDGLNFELYYNEIVGFIFDSMSEKNTFLNLFRGKLSLSSGWLFIQGKKVNLQQFSQLLTDVSIIEKNTKLIGTLTAGENVFLFKDRRKFLFGNKYALQLKHISEEFEIPFSLDIPIRKMNELERIEVELLKAYVEKKKIVIFADISGVIKSSDYDIVFKIMKKMRDSGMTFIVIESFEDIVFDWTEKIVVVRNGKTAGVVYSDTVNRQKLYQALLGNHRKVNTEKVLPLKGDVRSKGTECVLEFKNVTTSILRDISFSLEAGEVLKVLFMDEESCNAIESVLKGQTKVLEGNIYINHRKQQIGSISQAMKKGICFVEEIPHENMLFENMSVRDNLAIALAKKTPMVWARRRYSKSVDIAANDYFEEKISDKKLKKINAEKLLHIVFLKWLLYNPRVVVFIHPFIEIDIHLKEITLEIMKEMQLRGIAIIILTSKLSEIDKIDGDTLIIRNGKCIDEDSMYQSLYGGDGV